jgi:hypothetical protein
VITCGEILAEDRFLFAEIEANHCGIADNPARCLSDFDLARVTGWQRRDVRDQCSLVQATAFLIEVDCVVGVIFLPRLPVPRDDAVEQFLRPAQKFFLGDRRIAQSYPRRQKQNKNRNENGL